MWLMLSLSGIFRANPRILQNTRQYKHLPRNETTQTKPVGWNFGPVRQYSATGHLAPTFHAPRGPVKRVCNCLLCLSFLLGAGVVRVDIPCIAALNGARCEKHNTRRGVRHADSGASEHARTRELGMAGMGRSVLVEVDQLSRYFGKLAAVRDVSFTIRQGEILGFLGPNGAGKTTTMQILSGNLAPSRGSIRIAGYDLLENPRDAKAVLGYLPEQPPLYRELTVDEYLDYCAALNRIARPKRKAARDAAKEKCGLRDVGARLIGNLSKGYQQRVGLAQAVIHMPPLVILDEPTVGLDPIQIREIRSLIGELGQDHGVILSTHILPEVQTTCDRVLIIHHGELVLDETITGLEGHLKTASLTLAFHEPPPPEALARLPGVTSVKVENDGRLHVFHETTHNPTQEIIQCAAEQAWGLYEIRPGRLSLEQLFVELTAEARAEPAVVKGLSA